MTKSNPNPNFKTHYSRLVQKRVQQAIMAAVGVILFWGILGYYSQPLPAAILGAICLLLIFIGHRHYTRPYYQRLAALRVLFPDDWHSFLDENVAFYHNLSETKKEQFRQRVQFFLAEKKIEAIDTEIDDGIRLLVAASAIIPAFAFPFFDYPNLRQVFVYPNSFDRSFRTEPTEGFGLRAAPPPLTITGMVGSGFLNGTLILSKPDLIWGFQERNAHNVGLHEFVHLLDMADGAVDGLPEMLLAHAYTLPWLQVIKEEAQKIREGQSDINPYGLTNNAEFLAVVSEYFFDDPEKFEAAHPELYQFLCTIFHQEPPRY